MLDMSTTYVRPSLSIKSTPYRSIPNARPQRSAMSACSAVGVNGSPYFSASGMGGKTFPSHKGPTVLAQPSHPRQGRDLKIYVIGERLFRGAHVLPAHTKADRQ